jgi:RNA-directed DNA polymerase
MPPQNLFDRVISLDNIRSAWIKAKHYAQTEAAYFDSYAYDIFEEHLEANLAALHSALLNNTYHPAPLRYIAIPKGDKVRKVYFTDPHDSVVMQAVVNVIGPIFEAEFSDYSFGNRLSVGDKESHDIYRRWQDRYNSYIGVVRSFLNEGPDAWYLITDIQNCYPSINLERLRGLIAQKINDERVLSIIDVFLSLQAINLEEQLESVEGLPAGAIHAHFFANIYLAEFDKLAIQNARRYARYVDDICLVGQDEESLKTIEQILRDYLGRWGQDFKAEKTERHSIKDWAVLIDHTRKMKYAERLDFIGTLDLGSDQIEVARDAERLFHDLYFVVEKESDIDKLVENAGSVISQLRKLKATNLDDIIYSLLEIRPLKPSTLRVALSCLLEVELPNPSLRFEQYLAHQGDEWGYNRINFLQILPYFSENAAKLKPVLIENFSRDSNYLVRANTYAALKTLAERGVFPLSVEELRSLRGAETSPYALQRLIDCYTVTSGEAVWLPLVSLVTADNPKQTTAVAKAFCSLFESKRIERVMLDSVLPAFMGIETLGVESYTHLLYLTSKFGTSWMISELLKKARQQIPDFADKLFSIVALDAIQWFASRAQFGHLYQFSEIVNQVGLRTQAKLGFEEVISHTTDAELRQQAQAHRDALKQASDSIGLPSWYDPITCNRGLYRELKGDSEYLCIDFISETKQCAGTLELVSARRIQDSGFMIIGDWVAYLYRLDKEGLISLISTGSYNEDGLERAFCMYEKPQGFQTLKEWLRDENAEGLFPISVVLDIALSLAEAISKTDYNGFHLQSIDPLNVLWNPAGRKIKLLNIGASLGIPNYQCGIAECPDSCSRDEIGPSTATYHLGLLLFQLLRRTCPLYAINSTRSRYGDHPVLFDLVNILRIPPHFRLVLTRMLKRDPDYRYSGLVWLEQDLHDIAEFAHSLSAFPSESETDEVTWHTLKDFVTFRLKIISRNPELRANPPMIRAWRMLKDLSDSLAFLSESMLSSWKVHTQIRSPFLFFPSLFQLWNLSPEGRRLLAIAEGWEESTASPELSSYTPTPLTKLCLYQTLAIEASACLIASLTASSNISQDTVTEMNQVVLHVMGELKDSSSAVFAVHPAQQASIEIKAKFDSDDLQQLQQFISWLHGDHVSPYEKRANSLKATGLFLVLFGFDCELLQDGRLVARSKPVLNLKRTKWTETNLWQLLKDFAALDEEISQFEGTCLSENNGSEGGFYVRQAAEAWTRFPETVAFIQSLNPSRRYVAELDCYEYWERDGVVRLTFPHAGRLSFSHSRQFLSGNLIKDREAKRPIRVDVVSDASKGTREITSVLAPLMCFNVLPLSSRRLSPARTAKWMKEHPRWRLLTLAALGLGLPSVALWFINLLSGIEIPLFVTGVLDVLGALSLNLFADSIQSFLATRHPEDAQLVE